MKPGVTGTFPGMSGNQAELPSLAARGISRVLVPVTSFTGLQNRAIEIEGLVAWQATIARYAEL